MGRALRIQFPGAFYHITSRGNEQQRIFKNDTDREKFLSYLASATERYGGHPCLLPHGEPLSSPDVDTGRKSL